jgi:hypothetical protein
LIRRLVGLGDVCLACKAGFNLLDCVLSFFAVVRWVGIVGVTCRRLLLDGLQPLPQSKFNLGVCSNVDEFSRGSDVVFVRRKV